MAAAPFDLQMPIQRGSETMPRVMRQDISTRRQDDWAIAIPVGLAIAGLLGFVALYPMQSSNVANAGQAETVGVATAKPESAPAAKKPVRYEATIENWKRYRAANKTAE
jgi:hypothetical protein